LTRFAYALAAGALLLGVAACGSERRAGPSHGLTLADARAFDDFPLYYAGDRVDGLPLVAIVRRDDTARYVSFIYGSCVPGSDQGCAPPAEIQVWPSASRNLGTYDAGVGGAGPSLERVVVRDVAAAFLDEGTRLELFTDRSTIVIFSDSRERLLRIARALRCVTSPGSGATGGTLECG
jgi:hypothetical protein